MPEAAYKDILDTQNHTAGTFELIHNIDKNVRDINSELYIFRRETNRDFAEQKQRLDVLEASDTKHDKAIDRLTIEVSELKTEVKELRHDISDIKGDIKAIAAIAAGFGAAQNRFNWGLIILGLFVALIQLLK